MTTDVAIVKSPSRTGIYGENRDVDHIGGSDGWPLVGHTFDYLSNTYPFGLSMRERFGEVYRSGAFFMKFVVLASPDGIEYVLRDEAKNFSSKLGWEPFLARLFPNGLPTMDFDEHRHHRRIMQAVFRPAAMNAYFDLIDAVVKDGLEGWRDKGIVRAYPAIKAITLDIGARAFLGLDLQEDADFINRTFVTVNNGLAPIVPYPVPGLAVWRALRARERLFQYFRPLIPARKSSDGKDVLTCLVQAKDEDGAAFSDEAVLFHLITVLSAAHDTSTTSLTVALHYLAQHPEWQERLRKKSQALGTLTFDNLEQLDEHDWVFREALRIYPPAPQMFRRSVRDCEFHGHRIPANTQVMVDVGYVHRSAEHWTSPMTFDPERFSPARAEHKKHQYQWVPFGGGAHICIGMQFALMSARIVLHHLLTRYRIEKASDAETKFVILPITQPKDGLPLKVIPIG
jgi:cytochrome P450